jgi:iron complex outermembrane receptor protein
MLKFAGIVPIMSGDVSIGIDGRYVSSRQTVYETTAPDYFVMNVTLFSQALIPGVHVSGGLYNIFDNEFGDPAGWEHLQELIRQDGRTARLKFTYKF